MKETSVRLMDCGRRGGTGGDPILGLRTQEDLVIAVTLLVEHV